MLIEIIKGTGNFTEQEVYIDKEGLKIYLNKLVDEL